MALSLFDPFFRDDWVWGPVVRTDSLRESQVSLKVDFKEEGDKFVLSADAPGCSKDDVKVDVNEHTLTISAERKREESKDTDKYHVTERSYGRASRSFRLPASADLGSINAAYDNGVLKVTVNKLPAEAMTPKSRSIAIN